MKSALFNKRMHYLILWDTRNTTMTINCESLEYARARIEKTGIEQELRVI